MYLKASVAALLLFISHTSAFTHCTQRHIRDFRADENNCRVFHLCTMGQLVTFTCSQGSVFDESTRTCVPTHSIWDRCTDRMTTSQHCPPGSHGLVPHPEQCAQFYDCGAAQSQNRRGWEGQLRECPYPHVFSTSDNKCVPSTPGMCATRQEPLDQCDYKENQCEGHIGCVPCHLRFPTCRGLEDGNNPWRGRSVSPYYVTCHQQRVQSTGMCEQDGAVFIFDEDRRECVKQEETENPEVPETPEPTQQARPQMTQQPNNVPHRQMGYQPINVGYPQAGYQQIYRPQYPVQIPVQNQNQYQNYQYQQN